MNFEVVLTRKSRLTMQTIHLLKWLMVDGSITPKDQPLDVIINKVFKGLFRDLFLFFFSFGPASNVPKLTHYGVV